MRRAIRFLGAAVSDRAYGAAVLALSLLAGTAGAQATEGCDPGPFGHQGFVTIAGGHLRLDGQRFRVRGTQFLSGRGVDPYPLVALWTPTGDVEEEVYLQSVWNYTDNWARIESELRLLKNKLGINTIRVGTAKPPSFQPPYEGNGSWFQPDGKIAPQRLADLRTLLCICRRLDIKVHLAVLFNVQVDQGQYPPGGYPQGYVDFCLAHLDDLIPRLRNEKAILAYEVSNETLKGWFPMPTEGHLHSLQLMRTLIERVRSLQPNHPITTGEGAMSPNRAYQAPWRYPSPEFWAADLDGTGQLTRLVDLVDYISPHFYTFGVLNGVDFGPMLPVLEDMKALTDKPIVMGEMGREMDKYHTLPTDDDEIRSVFHQMAVDAMREACAGPSSSPACQSAVGGGTDGYSAWSAEPALDLKPGTYERSFHCWLGEPGCHHGSPYIYFPASGRGVHYQDVWELLYYPTAQGQLEPLAPGRIFRRSLRAPADLGADGTSDFAVYRPSTSQWLTASGGAQTFGLPGDTPVGADWNGDGRTDPAVVRVGPAPDFSLGWWISTVAYDAVTFGHESDVPVPADYDGDGETDIAVFRPSTGEWLFAGSFATQPLGAAGDIPVPADYDGDGDADIAVFRPATGEWFLGPFDVGLLGGPGDVPVPGDYDGDGDADIAIYRPSTGQWQGPFANEVVVLGDPGDLPVPADYDGDGRTDVAVYSPSTGHWRLLGAFDGTTFGQPGDVPVVTRPAP